MTRSLSLFLSSSGLETATYPAPPANSPYYLVAHGCAKCSLSAWPASNSPKWQFLLQVSLMELRPRSFQQETRRNSEAQQQLSVEQHRTNPISALGRIIFASFQLPKKRWQIFANNACAVAKLALIDSGGCLQVVAVIFQNVMIKYG